MGRSAWELQNSRQTAWESLMQCRTWGLWAACLRVPFFFFPLVRHSPLTYHKEYEVDPDLNQGSRWRIHQSFSFTSAGAKRISSHLSAARNKAPDHGKKPAGTPVAELGKPAALLQWYHSSPSHKKVWCWPTAQTPVLLVTAHLPINSTEDPQLFQFDPVSWSCLGYSSCRFSSTSCSLNGPQVPTPATAPPPGFKQLMETEACLAAASL